MSNNEAAMLQILTLLVQELKGTLNHRIDQIIEKIENYHQENKTLHDKLQKLTTEVEKHSQEIAELKNQAHTPQVQKAHITSPDPARPLPQRGIRRNNLIITGLQTDHDDPKQVIENFIQTYFPTATQGILAVQQLSTRGRNDATNNRGQQQSMDTMTPPRFLVTFRSVWDVQIVYNQRLQRLQGKNIFISEDLNPKEARLFYKARQLKKSKIAQTAWTQDGRVYIRREFGQDPIELYEEHPLLNNLENKFTVTPAVQSSPIIPASPLPISSTSPIFIPQSPSSSSSLNLNKENPPKSSSSSSTHSHDGINHETEPEQENNEEAEEDDFHECIQLIEGALTKANRKRRAKNKDQ
jgi:hypothetical protein